MALFKLGGLRIARKNMRKAVQFATAVWAPFALPKPVRKKPGAAPRPTARMPKAQSAVPTPRAAAMPGRRSAGFFDARFLYRRAEHAYKLYVPPLQPGQTVSGLVVMLHGCQQTPDDFAAGTRMNEHARDAQCAVLYPCQPTSANARRCWNWFGPAKQERGFGEPAWIAALARSVARQWGLRRHQVYIAGLSAGGAMAATVAHAYPDVFSACGVHSGLAAGAARGMVGALSAMRHGSSIGKPPPSRQVPTIVFHGDCDKTVHPRHGAHVIAAALRPATTGAWAVDRASAAEVLTSKPVGGHGFTRRIYRNARQQTVAEHWEVRGMGHAWSGGHARGTYVDAQGPDAGAAMLAFFRQVSAGRPVSQ